MQGLLIYIFGFSISVLFIALAEKIKDIQTKKTYRNILIIIALAIPITIASIRYNVGTDYNTYVSLYNKYSLLDLKNIFLAKEVEVFFVLVCKIAYALGNAQIMFFIYSILTVGIMFRICWENRDKISVSLMWFLYLFMFFGASMNIVRQSLAMVVVVYAYKYIDNRNFYKFIIFALLAICIHKTAIIIVPLYFILDFNKNRINNKIIGNFLRILIVIISFVFIINIEKIILFLGNFESFNKYITYINYSKDINNFSFILKLIVFVFITIFIKPMIKYDSKNKMYYYLLILDLILSLLGYKSPYLKRISYYFSIVEIFLLAGIPKILKIKKQKQIITICIIFYAISKFILTVYILKQGDLIPYITIFNR